MLAYKAKARAPAAKATRPGIAVAMAAPLVVWEATVAVDVVAAAAPEEEEAARVVEAPAATAEEEVLRVVAMV